MVFAGALLHNVKDWDVYLETPELFIMVQALLGSKVTAAIKHRIHATSFNNDTLLLAG